MVEIASTSPVSFLSCMAPIVIVIGIPMCKCSTSTSSILPVNRSVRISAIVAIVVPSVYGFVLTTDAPTFSGRLIMVPFIVDVTIVVFTLRDLPLLPFSTISRRDLDLVRVSLARLSLLDACSYSSLDTVFSASLMRQPDWEPRYSVELRVSASLMRQPIWPPGLRVVHCSGFQRYSDFRAPVSPLSPPSGTTFLLQGQAIYSILC